jgi:hypothetical protein
MAGRPKFEPTDQHRQAVVLMVGSGSFTHDEMALVIGCDAKTLRRAFRQELDTGVAKLNAKVVQTMFQMATSGNHPGMTAMWLKCRLRWREPTTDHRFVDAQGKDRPFLLSDADQLIAASDAADAAG